MRNSLIFLLVMLSFSSASGASGFCFREAGQEYRISPELLKAIARVESDFNPSAFHLNKNGSYDYGLMQINSCWRDRIGSSWVHLSDPCYNVRVGAWILRQCMNRYGNTWDAVACYHTGKGLADTKRPEQAEKYIRKIKAAIGNIQ